MNGGTDEITKQSKCLSLFIFDRLQLSTTISAPNKNNISDGNNNNNQKFTIEQVDILWKQQKTQPISLLYQGSNLLKNQSN